MDKLKVKARSARNRVAESASRGDGRGSLSEPHSALPPDDNASTAAVNEGYLGTAARDFAVSGSQPVHQPVVEPPTSLQSSVDAGTPVPTPRSNNNRSNAASGYGHRHPYGHFSPALGQTAADSHCRARNARARSNSAPQRRPVVGMRQSSIGIRRIPSAGELQQAYAAQNASTNALARSSSRLPALEEEVQLEPVNTGSTTSTEPDGPRTEPNALSRATSAVSAKLGFFRSKKGKEKEKELEDADDLPPSVPGERPWTNYSSNMVDVLDTVGTLAWSMSINHLADENRPGSSDPHVLDQYPELSLRPQSWQIRQSQANLCYAARTQRKREFGGHQPNLGPCTRGAAGRRGSWFEAYPDGGYNGYFGYH